MIVSLVALLLARGSSLLDAKSIFDTEPQPAAATPSTQPAVTMPPPPPSAPPAATAPAVAQTQPTVSATTVPTSQPQTRPTAPQQALYQLPQPIPFPMEFAQVAQVVELRFPTTTTKPSGVDQLALARTLMDAAAGEEQMATKFLLLKRAREAYLTGNDPAGAVGAVHEMAWYFDVDDEGLTYKILEAAAGGAELPATAAREIAKVSLQAAMSALRDQQYEWAGKMAAITEILARRSRDAGMLTLANQLVGQLYGLSQDYPRVQEAQERLAKSPGDPGDNLLVGRFFCLTCRQWSRGLPLLDKGSDVTLRGLAHRELDPPMDSDGQNDLADSWSALGRSMLSGRDRDAVLDRAAEWYEAAESHLKGSLHQTGGKAAFAAWADQMQHGLIAEVYSGQNFAYRRLTRLDQNIDVSWPTLGPEPGMRHADFSIYWRGYVAPPAPGVYRIVTKADDSMRVWIGGRLLVDAKVGSSFDAHAAYVTLGVDPQELRVEYQQANGAGYAGLGWIAPGERIMRAVPNSALLHAPVELAELFPPPLSADDSGAVWLPAAAADLHGQSIHFSDHDSGPALYDWHEDESATWEFTAPQGNYAVDLTYCCPDGSDGAKYTVRINGAKLTDAVSATGGPDKFQTTLIGNVHLLGGNVTLSVKSDSAPSGHMMLLQRIVLLPIP
jgi:hypothetical protein